MDFTAMRRFTGNCSQLPNCLAKNFTKELLNIEEIVSQTEKTMKNDLVTNPDIKVILTVSPKVYIKEGYRKNIE
jgi:hypothetical protein